MKWPPRDLYPSKPELPLPQVRLTGVFLSHSGAAARTRCGALLVLSFFDNAVLRLWARYEVEPGRLH
jgi:hypothetical protein